MNEESFGLLTKDSVAIPLTGVEVKGDITGRAAKVKVKQCFINREDKAVEAVYKFPLPENSSVCGFKAVIGERVWEGEIEDRDEAFKIYDEALAKGHGAYLLDEERPNIFTLSLGNLNPHNSAIIEIDYVMLLDTNGSEVRFLLPTTISPRYIPQNMKDEEGIPIQDIIHPVYADKVPYGLSICLDIHGRGEIAAIDSPSHSITTRFNEDPIKVELSVQTVAMDRDFILTIRYIKEFQNRAFYWIKKDEKFVQLDFSPALEAYNTEGDHTREIIFVLDCSGSMNGSSIEEAKSALVVFLRGMEKGMHFNICRFGSTFEKLFKTSKPYTEEHLETAVKYLSKVEADLGGTEVLLPLREIYQNGAKQGNHRSIVLITDGEIGNEEEVFCLVQAQANGTSLFTVGIGYGPNEYLIKQLARGSGGASESIAPGERIGPKVLRLFKKVVGGRIDNFTIQWSTEVEQTPGIPVVYGGETITILARVENDVAPADKLKISGDFMNSRREWLVDVKPVQGADIPVSLLWAREKIRELEDGSIDVVGSKQIERKEKSTKEKIITLSKKYSLISRETSYVAVEKRPDAQKTSGEVVFRKIPVMLTKDWHGGFTRGVHGVVALPRPSSQLGSNPVGLHGFRLDVGSHILHSIPRQYSLDSQETDKPKDLHRIAPHMKTKRAFLLSHMRKPVSHKIIPTSQDLLFSILSSQRAEGGFAIDKTLVEFMGVSFADLKKIAKKINSKRAVDNWILLLTAVVLCVLEKKFSGVCLMWESVIQKSKRWYEAEVSRVEPSIAGMPLLEWVSNYLDKKHVELKVK